MKRPVLSAILFVSFFALLSVAGCKKSTTDTSAPAITTQDVMLDVTSTSAQSGGTITSVGGSAITANGVCYSSTNSTPTIADLKTTDPIISTSYTFTSNITGLTANTTYYLRAYVTNAYGTGYGSVVKFVTSSNLASVAGNVTTFAGSGIAGYMDGTGTSALFSNPGGMAVDAQGNIYVSDTFNNRIRKITPAGVVTTVAGNGTAGYLDTDAADAEFYAPQGLAVDGQGNIYVADFGNNVIREISTAGLVSTYAGNGVPAFVDGAAKKVAAFNGPSGIAFDQKGNLYVADLNNNMVRKITSTGGVSLVAGITPGGYLNTTVDSATGVWGEFKKPSSIAVDASGNIYVADQGNSAIREITPAGVITTIAGGSEQNTLVGYPSGICIDANGNLFISDDSGRIIELTSTRTLYILAGAPNVLGYADGLGTAAQFSNPQGIGVDMNGNIYVSDSNNNRIRKINIVDVSNN
jgi:sugar lactone lactonase YvrE